jgi:hypothetical protein
VRGSLLILALALAPPAWGEDEPPKKEITCTGVVGFGGRYRPGGWVPVSLELRNTTDDDASLEVSASLAYGEGGQGTFSRSLELPRGGRKGLRLYVRPIQPFDALRVECRAARTGFRICGAELGARAVPSKGSLLLATGAGGLSGARAPQDPFEGLVEVGLQDLPDRPEGYDGVDWVILRDAAWAGDAVRSEALVQWVEAGGAVAVSGGEALHALARSSLGRRLGLALGEPQRVTGIRALRALAREDLDLPSEGGLCERVTGRGVRALASSGEVPLLLEAGVGAGELLLFAMDPEVFRGQPGYRGLWKGSLGLPDQAPEEETVAFNEESLLPGGWAQEVLSSALYHVKPIDIPWLWWFLGGYLLLVAPLDYALVRRLPRWRLAGLVTLTCWAVGGSMLCYQLGASGLFAETVFYRAGVLDAFPFEGGEGRLVGRVLTAIDSENNVRLDVAPPAGRGSAAVVVDPGNLPKSGLQPSDALAWTQDGASLALRRVQVYYATPMIFETRWVGAWKDLGLVLSRDGKSGWRLENHSPCVLEIVASGELIPPGGAVILGAPQAFPMPGAGAPLKALLGTWLTHPPQGAPWRFGLRTGDGVEGYAFWIRGLPLGIGTLEKPPTEEAVLLRIHPEETALR